MTNTPGRGRRRSRRVGGGRRGWPLFFYGLAFFVVGLVITVATYAAASGGGRYIISYGPMAIGLFAMIRGLIDVMRARRAEGQQPDAAAYLGTPAASGVQPEAFSQPWPSSPGPVSGGPFGPVGAGDPGSGYGSSGYAGSGYAGSGYTGSGDAGSTGFAPAGGPAPTPSAASVTRPAANWYGDPQDASKLRWWDGQAWTDHTHPRN